MGDAEYMREYRASNSAYAERNRNRVNARRRAMLALAERHKSEFHQLLQEQLRAMKNLGKEI